MQTNRSLLNRVLWWRQTARPHWAQMRMRPSRTAGIRGSKIDRSSAAHTPHLMGTVVTFVGSGCGP